MNIDQVIAELYQRGLLGDKTSGGAPRRLIQSLARKLAQTVSTTVQAGRQGGIGSNVFYRGIDGMLLDATTRGIPVPAGTLTFLGWSKTNAGTHTLEVLNNGAVITTLPNPGSGVVSSVPKVAVAAGLMSFRNLAGMGTAQNVQIVARIS